MILEQTKYRIGRLMNRASVPLFSPEGEKSTGQGEETEEEEEGGGKPSPEEREPSQSVFSGLLESILSPAVFLDFTVTE